MPFLLVPSPIIMKAVCLHLFISNQINKAAEVSLDIVRNVVSPRSDVRDCNFSDNTSFEESQT